MGIIQATKLGKELHRVSNDLPPALAVTGPARLLTGPGETADFEIAATERGDLQLRVSAPYTNRPWTIDVPVHVR